MAQTSKVINEQSQQNLDELATLNSQGVVNTFDNRYEGVRGTPFLNEKWKSANIKLQDKVIQNLMVKYNVYANNLLYKNADALLIIDLNKIDSFVLTDSLTQVSQKFRRVSSMAHINSRINNKFAAVLFDGNNSKLLNIPVKEFRKANYKGAYSNGETYDVFRDDNFIYFVDREGKPEKVKFNKRNLMNLLKDKKNEIEKFIADERINPDTEAGWIKTLAYYDKL